MPTDFAICRCLLLARVWASVAQVGHERFILGVHRRDPRAAQRPSRRLAERRVGGACGPPRMKRVVRKSLDHGELELFEVMGQALAGAR